MDALQTRADTAISIHAPLAGCDRPRRRQTSAFPHFNPRTPCGVRRRPSRSTFFPPRFQSTHPLRGATRSAMRRWPLKTISIHAPLAGCDRSGRTGCDFKSSFQSTHPLRGATLPLAVSNCTRRDFNPRTPCGVRPDGLKFYPRGRGFQSTHPLRGATGTARRAVRRSLISIHAPLAGCDAPCALRPAPFAKFQSTHPLRGATQHIARRGLLGAISIHAPLAGCDSPTGSSRS